MPSRVGVRELRQNLSRHLDRVKAGEELLVTEHGREVARMIPAGSQPYVDLAVRFGASVPAEPLGAIAARLRGAPRPAGTTDAHLAPGRADRTG